MAEQDPQQVKVQPDDAQFQLEQHIIFKRKQEAATLMLRRLMEEGLNNFQLIMDGTAYAYTKISLPNKGITIVPEIILQYPNLRQLQFNANQIADISNILKLKFLTHVNLSRNQIADCRFLSNSSNLPYAKVINLSNNKIKILPSLELKRIVTLNLSNNLIDSLQQFSGHPTLQVLELRGNKIQNLKGIQKINQLRQLFLADNLLKNVDGLGKLPKLKKLHLRKNKITDLTNFPKLQSLEYINLRQNQLTKLNFISGITVTVKTINLLANPVTEQLGDNTKKQAWILYRNYNKVNKQEITAQQRQQFDKQHKQRIAEKQRIQRQQRQNKQRQQRQAKQKLQQGA